MLEQKLGFTRENLFFGMLPSVNSERIMDLGARLESRQAEVNLKENRDHENKPIEQRNVWSNILASEDEYMKLAQYAIETNPSKFIFKIDTTTEDFQWQKELFKEHLEDSYENLKSSMNMILQNKNNIMAPEIQPVFLPNEYVRWIYLHHHLSKYLPDNKHSELEWIKEYATRNRRILESENINALGYFAEQKEWTNAQIYGGIWRMKTKESLIGKMVSDWSNIRRAIITNPEDAQSLKERFKFQDKMDIIFSYRDEDFFISDLEGMTVYTKSKKNKIPKYDMGAIVNSIGQSDFEILEYKYPYHENGRMPENLSQGEKEKIPKKLKNLGHEKAVLLNSGKLLETHLMDFEAQMLKMKGEDGDPLYHNYKEDDVEDNPQLVAEISKLFDEVEFKKLGEKESEKFANYLSQPIAEMQKARKFYFQPENGNSISFEDVTKADNNLEEAVKDQLTCMFKFRNNIVQAASITDYDLSNLQSMKSDKSANKVRSILGKQTPWSEYLFEQLLEMFDKKRGELTQMHLDHIVKLEPGVGTVTIDKRDMKEYIRSTDKMQFKTYKEIWDGFFPILNNLFSYERQQKQIATIKHDFEGMSKLFRYANKSIKIMNYYKNERDNYLENGKVPFSVYGKTVRLLSGFGTRTLSKKLGHASQDVNSQMEEMRFQNAIYGINVYMDFFDDIINNKVDLSGQYEKIEDHSEKLQEIVTKRVLPVFGEYSMIGNLAMDKLSPKNQDTYQKIAAQFGDKLNRIKELYDLKV